jgi:hypothetical protein
MDLNVGSVKIDTHEFDTITRLLHYIPFECSEKTLIVARKFTELTVVDRFLMNNDYFNDYSIINMGGQM